MNTKDFNKVNKREKGITLIALVITIIVLLILAAVSIAMLTGENGILKKASTSREKTEINSADEEIKLVISELKAEKQLTNVNTNEFLASKVPDSLDDYEKIDAEYELERKGYSLVINEDGDIIGKIQKSGTRPKIENIKITSVEGTEIENNSQEIGTKLKISFKVYIEGGKIDKVTPSDTLKDGEVTYTTNGTDTEISFTVIGNIDNKECKRTKTISIKDKYVVYKDSLLEAVEEAEQSDANASIRVLGENNEIAKYNADLIVYNGDLVFDGTEKNIENISLSTDKTYSIGNASKDPRNKMVILKVNGNITVNEGVTVIGCKASSGYYGPNGLMIYSTGILTNNGTISMSLRGSDATGQNVYLYKNKTGTYEYVPKVGASGAPSRSVPQGTGYVYGGSGSSGVGRQTRRWWRRVEKTNIRW